MEYKQTIMSKRLTITWFTFVFLIFLALAIFTFHKLNPFLLVFSEILIPVLFAVTVYFYLKSQRPIESISNSLNLLKEGDFSTTLVPVHSREVNRIIEVYNSMIAKLREERLSVREKNHFLDLLIESSPLGIIITDLDGKITHINKTAFGYSGLSPVDFKGQYLTDIKCRLIPGLSRLEYDKKQLIGMSDGQKFLCRKLYFMDSGFRHPFYLIEEFTEEIRKAEKVAYGKLIRMMAHEVNNTIGSVNSIMTTLQSSVDSYAEKDKDELSGILEVAIQRNHQLNRFMQNLSRVVKLPPPDKEPMDIGASLRVVAASFSAILLEKNIIIGTSIPDEPVVISADRSQMEQVFTNIIKNSIEAIGNDGRIIISLKKNPLCLTIEDDGTGLSGNQEEPVFTPFFSAKPGGQGIGLTLVKEILVNHGFTFSLKNREVKGAEFTIFFQ